MPVAGSYTGPMPIDVDRYLEWIGFGGAPAPDLTTLGQLQRLHLTAVPFENLSIVYGDGVHTSLDWSLDKIIEQGRGGWCFELNGAFGALLEAIGYRVIRLGAAVLLDGPSDLIDHLTLEVHVDQPYLVDVGFGASFINPLRLNDPTPQDGGTGMFQLIASPNGTTLTELIDGLPMPLYRYRRVAHTLDQFTPISDALQNDPTKHWGTKPFATRLLDHGPDRVTLTHDTLKVIRGEATDTRPIAPHDWEATLRDWFGYGLPRSARPG